jgi:hypothetical protein
MKKDSKGFAIGVLIVLIGVLVLSLMWVLVAHAADPSLPNALLTPGEVRPDLTQERICKTKWMLPKKTITDARYVPVREKNNVIKAYDYKGKRSAIEVDHLIPRCLGGADTEKNLWPQPYAGQWGARIKDQVERKACVEVCAGTLTLDDARHSMATDWIALYKRLYGETK